MPDVLPDPAAAGLEWHQTAVRDGDLAAAWAHTSFALRHVWVMGARVNALLMLDDGPQHVDWRPFEVEMVAVLRSDGSHKIEWQTGGIDELSPYVVSVQLHSVVPEGMSDSGEPEYLSRWPVMVQEPWPAHRATSHPSWSLGGWNGHVADMASGRLLPFSATDATAPPT